MNNTQPTHYEEFVAEAAKVRIVIKPFLEKFWGERCDDYSPHCACCIKWRQLDELLENPFEPGE